jgi:hypothetical protein
MGCETTRSFLHHDKDDEAASKKDKNNADDPTKPKAVSYDTSKIRSVDSDDKNPQPFFRSDRRASGLSSESRAIEADLGLY